MRHHARGLGEGLHLLAQDGACQAEAVARLALRGVLALAGGAADRGLEVQVAAAAEHAPSDPGVLIAIGALLAAFLLGMVMFSLLCGVGYRALRYANR